jgi:predicted AlkP superfamily phosphohydrolase/phosphomutase
MLITHGHESDLLPWLLLYIGPGPGLPLPALGPLLGALLTVLSMGLFFFRRFFQGLFVKFKRNRWFRFFVLLLLLIVGGVVMAFWSRNREQAVQAQQPPKVLVLGIDGMDPDLLEAYLAQDLLPNFARLKTHGAYARLATTNPAESPVAWSTFATGTNPGKHGLFDFIHRAPQTYLPDFALVRLEHGRSFSLGGTTIPIGAPRYVSQRHGAPFWSLTSAADVATTVLRCPVTFPPEEVRGRMLSGMGVPDLRGSQGTFSYWTTEPGIATSVQGGKIIALQPNGDRISTVLSGPSVTQDGERGELTAPLEITLNKTQKHAVLNVQGKTVTLHEGEWSTWLPVSFRAGLLSKLHGMCRFYLKSVEPSFALYGSPINFAPENPPYPISFPKGYAGELASAIGEYHTQGMPEDTWALNEGRLDEESFLQHCRTIYQEREAMLHYELARFQQGVLVVVFDTVDRIQHMFWRAIDTEHPLYTEDLQARYGKVIEGWYREVDTLLGNVMKKIDDNTVLLVLSDHGFAPFRRAVHLNTWLRQHGYLRLKENREEGRGYGQDIDWAQTRAYALGIGGVYLNLKGREPQGVVEPGEEAKKLSAAIAAELQTLTDAKTGQPVVRRAYRAEEVYKGPEAAQAPDLLIGFERGYRASWQTALGGVPRELIEDNTKKWSGDHIVDPELVPGILLVNRALSLDKPHLADIAPTILKLVGAAVPDAVDGRVLW